MNQTKEVDETFVHDLVLCAVNDGQIYECCGKPCITNLQRKIKKGTFDRSKAPKIFELYFLTLARKAYGENIRMNASEKKLFGEQVFEHYEEEIMSND